MKNLVSIAQPSSRRPISFSSSSIEGIENGTITHTHRLLYPQPENTKSLIQDTMARLNWYDAKDKNQNWRCPYGLPGDQLWVRQMWARVEPCPMELEDYRMPLDWRVEKTPDLQPYWRERIIFYSDFPGKEPEECGRGASDNLWRTPTTMPRWAARLWLKVTKIKILRLQAIRLEDVLADGLKQTDWEENAWAWSVSFKKIEAQKDGNQDEYSS
jgi:hypothetical protein